MQPANPGRARVTIRVYPPQMLLISVSYSFQARSADMGDERG